MVVDARRDAGEHRPSAGPTRPPAMLSRTTRLSEPDGQVGEHRVLVAGGQGDPEQAALADPGRGLHAAHLAEPGHPALRRHPQQPGGVALGDQRVAVGEERHPPRHVEVVGDRARHPRLGRAGRRRARRGVGRRRPPGRRARRRGGGGRRGRARRGARAGGRGARGVVGDGAAEVPQPARPAAAGRPRPAGDAAGRVARSRTSPLRVCRAPAAVAQARRRAARGRPAVSATLSSAAGAAEPHLHAESWSPREAPVPPCRTPEPLAGLADRRARQPAASSGRRRTPASAPR